MTIEKHFAHVAEKVKEIQAWAEENRSRFWFDDFVHEIQEQIDEVAAYAGEHDVPFFMSAREVADKNYDDADGYSEEESSSEYYEEESSEYEEEEVEEEDSEYEEEESSW